VTTSPGPSTRETGLAPEIASSSAVEAPEATKRNLATRIAILTAVPVAMMTEISSLTQIMVEASKTTEPASIAEMSPENLMGAVATTGTTNTAADQTSRAETPSIIAATTAKIRTVTGEATTREVLREEAGAAIVMKDEARHNESASARDLRLTRALRRVTTLEVVQLQ
jgi:hypothetical protein